MKLISQNLHQFFFHPVAPYPLSILRIGVAMVYLIQAILLFPQFFEYFGDQGIINQQISEIFITESWAQPSLLQFYTFLKNIFPQAFSFSFNQFALSLFITYILSLIFLMLGWRTHLSAFFCWWLHFTFINSAPVTTYGVDRFAHIFFFYLLWMPSHKVLSWDSWQLKRKNSSNAHERTTAFDTLSLRLAQFHLCLVYFQSGMAKATGSMWWNGEAIWVSVMSPEYHQFDLSWMAFVPLLPTIAGYATLAIEIGYPFFIWNKKLRPWWVFSIIILHLFIAIFQGLWIFAMAMIAFNIGLFLVPTTAQSEKNHAWTYNSTQVAMTR